MLVIGGGDVAIDAARTALRLGAKKVTIAYRRTRAEMPAHDKEIAWAQEESVEMRFLLAPQRIVGNGKVERIECLRMALGEFDAGGWRKPEAVPGSEVVIKADAIIAAIGQAPEMASDGNGGLALSRRGTIDASAKSLVTTQEGVFAAGDAVTGPATVIQAIAQGERAAVAVDRYLRGEELDREVIVIGAAPPKGHGAESGGDVEESEVEDRPRAVMRCLRPRSRKRCLDEVELGFNRSTAMAEASRCLHCQRS